MKSRVRRLLLFIVYGGAAGLMFWPIMQSHKCQCAHYDCYQNDDKSWAATFAGKHRRWMLFATAGLSLTAIDVATFGRGHREFLPHRPAEPRESTGFSLVNYPPKLHEERDWALLPFGGLEAP